MITYTNKIDKNTKVSVSYTHLVVVLYWNKLWPFYIRPISKKQQAVLNRHGAVSRGILTFVEKMCIRDRHYMDM